MSVPVFSTPAVPARKNTETSSSSAGTSAVLVGSTGAPTVGVSTSAVLVESPVTTVQPEIPSSGLVQQPSGASVALPNDSFIRDVTDYLEDTDKSVSVTVEPLAPGPDAGLSASTEVEPSETVESVSGSDPVGPGPDSVPSQLPETVPAVVGTTTDVQPASELPADSGIKQETVAFPSESDPYMSRLDFDLKAQINPPDERRLRLQRRTDPAGDLQSRHQSSPRLLPCRQHNAGNGKGESSRV